MTSTRHRRTPDSAYLNYYRCCTRRDKGKGACSQSKGVRAEVVEEMVWGFVSGLLKDPEQLRDDLDAMIELERDSASSNPERETKTWLDQLAKVDRKRSGFQDMAAEGLITLDELRTKLAALDEIRTTAERELEALKSRQEHLSSLEQDKEALLETYAALTPEALGSLTSEERHRLYKMLRLRVVLRVDGTLEISGTFVEDLKISELEAIS